MKQILFALMLVTFSVTGLSQNIDGVFWDWDDDSEDYVYGKVVGTDSIIMKNWTRAMSTEDDNRFIICTDEENVKMDGYYPYDAECGCKIIDKSQKVISEKYVIKDWVDLYFYTDRGHYLFYPWGIGCVYGCDPLWGSAFYLMDENGNRLCDRPLVNVEEKKIPIGDGKFAFIARAYKEGVTPNVEEFLHPEEDRFGDEVGVSDSKLEYLIISEEGKILYTSDRDIHGVGHYYEDNTLEFEAAYFYESDDDYGNKVLMNLDKTYNEKIRDIRGISTDDTTQNSQTLIYINYEDKGVICHQYDLTPLFTCDSIAEDYYTFFPIRVWQEGKIGIIDKNLEYLVEPKYENLTELGYGSKYWLAESSEGSTVLDSLFKPLFDLNGELAEYGFKEEDGQELMIVIRDGKYGVLNMNGEEVVPFIYDEIDSEGTQFGEGDDAEYKHFLLCVRGDKYDDPENHVETLLSYDGETIIPESNHEIDVSWSAPFAHVTPDEGYMRPYNLEKGEYISFGDEFGEGNLSEMFFTIFDEKNKEHKVELYHFVPADYQKSEVILDNNGNQIFSEYNISFASTSFVSYYDRFGNTQDADFIMLNGKLELWTAEKLGSHVFKSHKQATHSYNYCEILDLSGQSFENADFIYDLRDLDKLKTLNLKGVKIKGKSLSDDQKKEIKNYVPEDCQIQF